MASEVVLRALERFKIAKEGWDEIYEKARDDLRFLSDEPNAQWDVKLLNDRKNRPIYTVDQLTQFVHQVENDERMNTPSIDIIPDDEGMDVETAEVLQGIIRGIEYKSNADAAYDTAGSFAIRSSIGFIRVDHGYTKKDGFEQELLIKRVVNPQSIYIDPNSTEPDGSDAMYGFVLEEISVEDFNKKYPDKDASSFTEKPTKALQDQDKITIVEYFEIVEDSKEYGLTEDGDVQIKAKGVYKSTRKVVEKSVKRYWLSRTDELEATDFPGEYIPIVPVYGEEAWIEGKRNLYSLIRKAKSSQQMFNLGISLDVEMLMKQPQASFMAAAGQVSGFEHEYSDPTKANVLHYNVEDVDGNKMPPPQRIAPPQSAVGFINMSREAVDNIKSTLGMYNASVGQKSNETSGIAIQRRQQEGDVGNFHFGDNLVRSITQVGKIIVCARKNIYDTPRAVKMTDREENTKMVGINGYRVQDQERDYHIKDGDCGVRVTTGPSFTTQRQEAAESYTKLIQAMPDLMPVIGDLVFKYQDSAGSQAISARLKKIVDPKLLSDEEKDQPDPQVEALTMQIQQITQAAEQQVSELQAQLADKQGEMQLKQGELQLKAKELDIKEGDQQLKALEIQSKSQLESRRLDIDQLQVEQTPTEVPQNTPLEQSPVAMKLDTTGFQYSKTPEQTALEEAKLQSELQEKQQQAQSNALLAEAAQNITQVLAALVQQTQAQTQATIQQTQAMMEPVKFIKDDQGNLLGAV